MPIPCYLALTDREFSQISSFPETCAWMACHFSGYGTGLTNLPRTLPPGSIVIVNDRMPVCGHDPQRILEQLQTLSEQVKPMGFLLDFQRPGETETQEIARVLTEGLSCPVAVTAEYGKMLSCPVFLEPPPLYVAPETHFAPWAGRGIWLEATFDHQRLTVTAEGCTIETIEETALSQPVFYHKALCCSYCIQKNETAAIFTLRRKKEELEKLLVQAEEFGIQCAVGLYQQLTV